LHVGRTSCVHGASLTQAQVTALQFHGRYVVDALSADGASSQRCDWLIVDADRLKSATFVVPSGWKLAQSVRRRSSTDSETLLIYQRLGP
jgi:hypothetical protein